MLVLNRGAGGTPGPIPVSVAGFVRPLLGSKSGVELLLPLG